MFNAKTEILKELIYCVEIARDICKNNCSTDVLQHAKRFAEIESSITGETFVSWIRINYDCIYVYIDLDETTLKPTGRRWYELDFEGSYGAEAIIADSVQSFLTQVDSFLEWELINGLFLYYDADEFDDRNYVYIPYERRETNV